MGELNCVFFAQCFLVPMPDLAGFVEINPAGAKTEFASLPSLIRI